MVLYKRKPVNYSNPPQNLADNDTVWVLKATGEVFKDYEEYLKRYDYLSQKSFTDAINGKSGLTYFQALESELKSSTSIENVFPEVLRDPILRKVQFSTTSRIDDLVSAVFEEFKKDFFPGEEVLIILDNGETMEGSIREKAKFPIIRGPEGNIQRPAFSRYFVTINNSRNEALLDEKHLRRQRNVFTKQNLRSFLKSSLQREAWIGAPWLVKEHLAIHYRLPMEIPQHLLRDAQIQIKMNPAKGRGPRAKNMSVEESAEAQQIWAARQNARQNDLPRDKTINGHLPIGQARGPPPPPAPPPIKYPIEDLDLPMRSDMPESKRPRLDFFTREQEKYILKGRRPTEDDVEMSSMGILLEVWNTLNVQAEVYVLDSFTFDDFVDALRYQDPDNPCELLEEVFCAVLKHIVDHEGKVHVKLPEVPDESDEDESEENDESEVSIPAQDVPAGRTRSRLSHVELAVDDSDELSGVSHRAVEMLGGKSWQSRLQARDFEKGGWQVILVGLLYQLSFTSIHKERCERLLSELAPIEEDPTAETAEERFATLDVNMRISALELITMLSISTKALKDFLDACTDDQTDIRKNKIELQRRKKELGEQLSEKDREYRILLPENTIPLPEPEDTPQQTNGDSEMLDSSINSEDTDDDAPRRLLRGGLDRKRKREEEIEKAAKAKAEKLEREKNKPKQSREFIHLIKERESLKKKITDLEAKIEECDSDLREANVQRTKVLGKDRYCNRYYWFERNGQPFGGLPSSSTAHYGYSNGRLWVQGPDQMEIAGFITRTDQEQKEYKSRFGKTVPERRAEEEGVTSLSSAYEWGFIDDEPRLSQLIQWLDDKGERERSLKKELMAWQFKIAEYMKALRDFKDVQAAKKAGVDDEMQVTGRVSTRNKLAEVRSEARDRCTKWQNGMARDQLNGAPHSRPSLAVGRAKGKKAKAAAAEAKAMIAGKDGNEPARKGLAVPLNRAGKPVGRQGGSYSFK